MAVSRRSVMRAGDLLWGRVHRIGEARMPQVEPARSPGGAPVVLLHGQPGDRSDWDAVISCLPGSIDAMALDRPGYGENPCPATTVEDNARWLVERLEREQITDAVLVGHSYGGGVALAAAAMAPERVRGLVLLASVGPGCLTPWDTMLAAPVAGPMISVTAWSLLPWLARRYPDHTANPSWQALAEIHHAHGAVWRSFLFEQRELRHGFERWIAALQQASVPTLVVADSTDKVVPVATARALHEQLPCSRLELVHGGGHQLPRRIPQVIAAAITDFVESLD